MLCAAANLGNSMSPVIGHTGGATPPTEVAARVQAGTSHFQERETMRISTISLGALLLATAAPALAQEVTAPPPPFTVTGGVTLTTDYRFRGLSQSNDNPALQATLNLNSTTGFYAGVWASTIDGGPDGSTPALTGYGAAEVDLYAGYTKTIDAVGLDVGLLYYLYPDRSSGVNTDFFEPYASVSYTLGPVKAKVGGAYAFGGQDGLNFTASSDDNIYVYGDLAVGVPNSIVTLKGHVGYSDGALGLANITSTDKSYFDYSATAEIAGNGFTAGVSYVDTDISNFGGFAQRLNRGSTILGYLTYSF